MSHASRSENMQKQFVCIAIRNGPEHKLRQSMPLGCCGGSRCPTD
jgi:hypothetical protein